MELIQVKLEVNDSLYIHGYYQVLEKHYHEIMSWYEMFSDSVILSDMILTPMNFTIKHIDMNSTICDLLLEWDNPFPVLESIPELHHLFNEHIEEIKYESDDDILYTETENINKLIDADKDGRTKDVSMLLSVIETKTDSIVKKIRKKNNK